MADEEVDFDETVDLGEGDAMETAPTKAVKGRGGTDKEGRRFKGRGAAGSSGEIAGNKGQFDTIDSKGAGRGAMKCAPLPLRIRSHRARLVGLRQWPVLHVKVNM